MQRLKSAPTAITQCEGCQVHLMLDMDLQGSEMMAAAWRKPLHMGELQVNGYLRIQPSLMRW